MLVLLRMADVKSGMLAYEGSPDGMGGSTVIVTTSGWGFVGVHRILRMRAIKIKLSCVICRSAIGEVVVVGSM